MSKILNTGLHIILGGGNEMVEKYRVELKYWNDQYPFYYSSDIDVTGVGHPSNNGDPLFVNKRFVKNDENGNYMEFEVVSPIGLRLENAKIIRTKKGNLVVVPEPGSELYVVEIPSGYRGNLKVKVLKGQCEQAGVGIDLNWKAHLYCNGSAEIEFAIGGRTRTASYEKLEDLFGDKLTGKIRVGNGKVVVVPDEELDQLLN
jgi:hypothetical protein